MKKLFLSISALVALTAPTVSHPMFSRIGRLAQPSLRFASPARRLTHSPFLGRMGVRQADRCFSSGEKVKKAKFDRRLGCGLIAGVGLVCVANDAEELTEGMSRQQRKETLGRPSNENLEELRKKLNTKAEELVVAEKLALKEGLVMLAIVEKLAKEEGVDAAALWKRWSLETWVVYFLSFLWINLSEEKLKNRISWNEELRKLIENEKEKVSNMIKEESKKKTIAIEEAIKENEENIKYLKEVIEVIKERSRRYQGKKED